MLTAVTVLSAPPLPLPRHRARVLVVEDDALTARFLRRLLRETDVLLLASPKQALARLRRGERFDFILCDMCLHEMPGHELYEAVEHEMPELAARFAFLTGGIRSEGANAFLVTAPVPVLQKPFQGAEVLTLLARVVGRPT